MKTSTNVYTVANITTSRQIHRDFSTLQVEFHDEDGDTYEVCAFMVHTYDGAQVDIPQLMRDALDSISICDARSMIPVGECCKENKP